MRVRVVLVAGEGKGFCAGGDVEAWSAMSAADFQVKWVRLGHRVFDRLARLRQPTIAVLSGHALGGGLELAAAADFRVAERHSQARLPRKFDRRRAWLVGHAARGAPLRRANRAAHGDRRRDPAGRPGAGAGCRRPRGRHGQRPGRGQGLGKRDRRARAARHRGHQDDDRHRRGRGERRCRRDAGQRLHRVDRRPRRRASRAFRSKQKPAFSTSRRNRLR